jgi:hypothetical protein
MKTKREFNRLTYGNGFGIIPGENSIEKAFAEAREYSRQNSDRDPVEVTGMQRRLDDPDGLLPSRKFAIATFDGGRIVKHIDLLHRATREQINPADVSAIESAIARAL